MSFYYPQAIVNLRVTFENFSDEDVRKQPVHEWAVIAKNLKVNLNSYMEADTFSATFDYRNLPFDPRIIRACGVTIYMEDKGEVFITDKDKEGFRAVDQIKGSNKNVIFSGFADTDKIELSETRSVTLEGRDFTSLLIDREYLGEPITQDKQIDDVIRGLLDEIPSTKLSSDSLNLGLQIELHGIDKKDLPIMGGMAAGKGPMDGAINPRGKRSYWDKIQEMVSNAGLIAYISINKLIITAPRNLYDRNQAKVFVYGRNVSDLSFERKLGRQKGFNVRVVSFNASTKTLLDARIPEQATDEWCKSIGIAKMPIMLGVARAPGAHNHGGAVTTQAPKETPKGFFSKFKDVVAAKPSGEPNPAVVDQTNMEPAPYISIKIKNVDNQEQLIKIGEKVFEELGRQQIEGKLQTKEMKIYSPIDGKDNFLSTQFRVGTPIEVKIDQDDFKGLQSVRATTKEEKNLSAADAIKSKQQRISAFLRGRGYGHDKAQIADAMALALTQFDTPFFTKAVQYTLDHQNGFEMELEFINFIEIPKNLVEGKLKALTPAPAEPVTLEATPATKTVDPIAAAVAAAFKPTISPPLTGLP